MSGNSEDEPPIGFSVLRLSKPDFVTETPIKLNLEEDIVEGTRLILDEKDRSQIVGEEGFAHRVHAVTSSDISGCIGYLSLPSSLGQIHLGEVIFNPSIPLTTILSPFSVT